MHDDGSKKRRRARGRLGARRGRATSRTSTSHGDPDQDGESISSKPGTSIEARVSESVEGSLREYVRREYRCADCDAHTKPQPSRKAAIPRTYEFNRIIALDVFYIPLRGQSLPILNIICHGTNFQVVALMRQDGTPTAAMVWSTFQRSWRRYLGTPDVLITDGGPEFRGDFAQSGEYAGILQVIVDADAPWQNGKCERHGGLVKDLLAKGLETEVVFTPDDLEDLLAEIVSLKNRRGNRGGSTPYQLRYWPESKSSTRVVI